MAMESARIKKLIHRANYRGFREADLILGGFAKAHAHELPEEQVEQFERLLEEKDHDIYDWISGTRPLPSELDTDLFAQICIFALETG